MEWDRSIWAIMNGYGFLTLWHYVMYYPISNEFGHFEKSHFSAKITTISINEVHFHVKLRGTIFRILTRYEKKTLLMYILDCFWDIWRLYKKIQTAEVKDIPKK